MAQRPMVLNSARREQVVKVNQIGTLTETLDAIQMANRAGYTASSVMSVRLVRWPAQRCRVESSMQRVFVSRLRATTFARYRAVPVRALWPKASTASTSAW